jgi:hypothetical protein
MDYLKKYEAIEANMDMILEISKKIRVSYRSNVTDEVQALGYLRSCGAALKEFIECQGALISMFVAEQTLAVEQTLKVEENGSAETKNDTERN